MPAYRLDRNYRMIPGETLKRIRELVAKDKLVLFVGAGISFSAPHISKPNLRIPMWSSLAKKVAKDAGINPNDYHDVLDVFDAVRVNFGRPFLEERVAKHLDDRSFSPSKIHNRIMDSGISTIYTTNYDSLLTRAGVSYVVASEKEYDRQQTDSERFIYQIHGSLQDLHTLTREDYRTWEARRQRAILKLMQHLAEKSFLFVGYSLRDPHLSDGILPHVKKILQDRQHPHYAWMWELRDGPRRLLSERDGIEAYSIDSDQEWTSAFEQISVKRDFKEHQSSPASSFNLKIQSQLDSPSGKINAYKLYYYRTYNKKTIKDVAAAIGITVPKYKSLERIINPRSPPSTKNFKNIRDSQISALEDYLQCHGELRVNGKDDLRGLYIEYYIRKRFGAELPDEVEQDFLNFPTKAVVFDFDGTLTVSDSNETTWESMWGLLGYDIAECAKYHAMFTSGRITHRKWCEITRDRFRERGLSREMVAALSNQIRLLDGIPEVFSDLKQRGIPIFIVSGSVKEIIRGALGVNLANIDGLFANSFEYDANNVVKHIESTKFDFEGKADYLNRLALDMNISTAEILFVGNSINDEFAARSGARTLCINPMFTNPDDRKRWNYARKKVRDLREILPFTQYV